MNEMSAISWSPKNPNLIAIGSRSNEILLMDISSNVVFKKMQTSHGFVTDIRWNPGGEGVILVKHD
jgi:WD40 repeat protein